MQRSELYHCPRAGHALLLITAGVLLDELATINSASTLNLRLGRVTDRPLGEIKYPTWISGTWCRIPWNQRATSD